MTPTFVAISTLHSGISDLAVSAESEGFGMVRRLVDDYIADVNRFSKRGECLCIALHGDHVIAIGGINVDPYHDSSSLGRIRHLYVSPDFRRDGVGRRLMELIEGHGRKRFETFQLFTESLAASRFYEALSYVPVHDRWKVSHTKRVGA